MADISDGSVFSETDAGNSSNTNPGFPEGMMPSRLNDAARALQGAVKRFWDRINGTLTTAGTQPTYTLTYTVAPTSYVTGESYSFKVHAANTGAATLNVNGLGAKNLYKPSGTGAVAMTGGEMQAGMYLTATYDGAEFVINGLASNLTDATNGGLSISGSTIAIAPSDLTAKTAPTSSDLVVIGDAAASNAPKKSTIGQVLGSVGGLGAVTKGTKNAVNVSTAQSNVVTALAHGLSRAPDVTFLWLECASAELGYGVGDRTLPIPVNAGNNVPEFMVATDATNTTILAQNMNVGIMNKSTGSPSAITQSKWSIVAVPVIFNGVMF